MLSFADSRVDLLPVQNGVLDFTRMMRSNVVETKQVLWRAGARGGKTHGLSYAAFEDAISLDGGGDYLVCAPTWAKCKEVVKPAFMQWAAPYCTRIQDRFAWLKNGIRCCFLGMHNPSAIDGFTARGGWGDEIKDWKRLAFQKANERTMSTGGLWLYGTTPDGFNWIYDEFEGDSRGRPGYRHTINSTTYDGKVDRQAVDDLSETMDKRMFDQQILGLYTQFSGQIHYNFDRRFNMASNVIIDEIEYPVEYDPRYGPVALFMDFNVNPMAGGLGQAVIIGDEIYIFIFCEIQLSDSNTPEFLDVVCDRLKGYGINKKQVIVYPDPAGKARATQGKSNYKIIKDIYGFNYKARKSHPAVVDRTNAVNRLICDKNGRRHIFINPRCVNVRKTMEQHRYKPGTNTPDKESGVDHMDDALGYWIEYEFPISYLTPRQLINRQSDRGKLIYNP